MNGRYSLRRAFNQNITSPEYAAVNSWKFPWLSKLSPSDWTGDRALLAKHGRRDEEFRLSEEHLRRSADGTPEGFLWVIQVRTGRGVTFHVDKFRSNWLEVFDSYLQQELFPRDS